MNLLPNSSQLTTASQCVLLPGLFGLSVQFALGLVSFSTLLVKYRYFEKYRRTFDVFVRDVSKIAIGGIWIHLLNLFTSFLLFEWFKVHMHSSLADSCDWYFLNIILDTTLGVAINYVLLKLSQKLFHYICGYYDTAPLIEESKQLISETGGTPCQRETLRTLPMKLWHKHHEWEKQIFIWLLVVTMMKVIIAVIMLTCHYWLSVAVHSLMYPLEGSPNTKLVVVMIIVPTLFNIVQYWITDQFLEYPNRPISKEEKETQSITPDSSLMKRQNY